MGQYWVLANLDKREYVHPHKLGCGMKLWEQLANHPSTGTALMILCAAMPEQRAGGDLDFNSAVAKRTIGRWAGDRVVFIGDYAEQDDLKPRDNADLIYNLCSSESDRKAQADYWIESCGDGYKKKAARLMAEPLFTDISEDVCAVIEKELDGKFTGKGWREFKPNQAEDTQTPAIRPDMVLTT